MDPEHHACSALQIQVLVKGGPEHIVVAGIQIVVIVQTVILQVDAFIAVVIDLHELIGIRLVHVGAVGKQLGDQQRRGFRAGFRLRFRVGIRRGRQQRVRVHGPGSRIRRAAQHPQNSGAVRAVAEGERLVWLHLRRLVFVVIGSGNLCAVLLNTDAAAIGCSGGAVSHPACGDGGDLYGFSQSVMTAEILNGFHCGYIFVPHPDDQRFAGSQRNVVFLGQSSQTPRIVFCSVVVDKIILRQITGFRFTGIVKFNELVGIRSLAICSGKVFGIRHQLGHHQFRFLNRCRACFRRKHHRIHAGQQHSCGQGTADPLF